MGAPLDPFDRPPGEALPDGPFPPWEPPPYPPHPREVIVAPPPRPERRWINVLLLLATIVTTTVAGAFLAGADVLAEPMLLWRGIPFSASLLLILGVHESAHYILSRRHGLSVTLPYFIPAPSMIGTMGAVIRIKSHIGSRRALLDVGVSGPLAGFVVALPVTAVGLAMSQVKPLAELGEEGINLGSSLLFALLARLFAPPEGPGLSLVLHPVAFAGWVGLLVTAMNLLPVGQLDGGHIVRALFGRRQQAISKVALAALVPLGFLWEGWFVWAVVLLIMGWRHPPVFDDHVPLDRRRLILGWVALAVLALTFTPAPFSLAP
jgi:membrane-associated protease RseP (regulator of RpoE activity)